MNESPIQITKLKHIINQQLQTDKKVLDKDVAQALNIKPTTLASHKSRNKPPYQAILTYCHDNRLDVRKVLFDVAVPIVRYPAPVEDAKLQVRYFKSLKVYACYLAKLRDHS